MGGKNIKESVVNEAKYDIGMARKGNGITVYNRAEEERGDYKNIAHISDNGVVKYYDKKLPNDVKKKIEAEAQKMKESVNEEIKVGSMVTIDYPTLKKPIKSKVVRVLNDKNGLLYVMKDGSVWDAKYISTNESVNESKSMKLTSMIKESFGIGELPSSKLMKMNMSLGEIMNEVSPYGNDVGDSKAGFSVGDSVTIAPKAGYWDVTQYPYGGDFKRIPSGQNVSGKVVSGTVKIPTREVRVDINVNGKSRTIVIDKKFLIGESTINERKMEVTKISDIPNLQKLVDQGKVTYRGLGMGKLYGDFYNLAGEGGTRIKVNGKEYYITDTDFEKLGGIKKIKFAAPFRRG